MNSISAISIAVIEEIMLLLIPVFYLWSCMLLTGKLNHAEGRVRVKFFFVREVWLKAVKECTSSGSDVSSYGRDSSRKYETLRTGADDSGEDFQNTGTFIVVRSSVFSISSALSSPLARDAYNALWNGRRPGQEQNCSYNCRSVHKCDRVWEN